MCSNFLRGVALAAVLLGCGAKARELRVCADPNNLPFSNEAGEGLENKLATLVAEELGAEVRYTWWAQRRGFLRNTLNADACDLVPGMPADLENVRTTAPYYHSTYVFVTRAEGPRVASFDDPVLRQARIGVHLIGDNGWNTPPAHALTRRGIVGNVRGFMIYGDYQEPNPPARILKALAAGEIDVAIVWGPLGGYFATREVVPLTIAPVHPPLDELQLPMTFAIAMAVRKNDDALRREVDAALARRRADVDAILARYDLPRIDAVPKSTEGAR
jgi:mxaJ protein